LDVKNLFGHKKKLFQSFSPPQQQQRQEQLQAVLKAYQKLIDFFDEILTIFASG
jgi:hypothetical protein